MSWENSSNLAILAPRSSGKTSVLTSDRLSTYRTVDLDDWVGDALVAQGTTLNEVMTAGAFDKISRVFERVNDVFHSAEIVGMPAGALSYESVRNLLGKVSVFAFLPGADQREALDVLVGRESQRPHFQDVPLTELQEKVAKDLSGFVLNMRDMGHEVVFTDAMTPDEIAALAVTELDQGV